MTKVQDFDLIVIGAGSGGVRAARMAANYGAQVAVIEAAKLGGTCVNLGCVPKKLLAYAAHFATDFADAKGFGWTTQSSFDWQELLANKNAEIQRLNGIYAGMFDKAGVTLYQGVGRYLQQENELHSVECLGDQGPVLLRAKRVLLATGGRPSRPSFVGAEHVLVSDDLFCMQQLPKTMTIIGGGYIAVEFASIFAGLGVKVELLLRSDRILSAFDQQLADWLEVAFATRGIVIHKNVDIHQAERGPAGVTLQCQQAGQPVSFASEVVVAAIGREPAIPEGVSSAVLDERRFVQVNTQFETSIQGLYALGDLLNGPALTPVAIKQGQWLADTWFKANNQASTLSIPSIPTAIFTHPAIATVGASEQQLRQQGVAYKRYQSDFRPMKHTLAASQLRVGLKLLVSDDQQQKVLGVHMFGDEAPEIIQGLALAFDMGATKQDFDRTLGIHPTVAEEWVTLK